METTFFIRTKKNSGKVYLSIRIQDPKNGLNLRQSTPIEVDKEAWEKAAQSKRAMAFYRGNEPELWAKLDEIRIALNAATDFAAGKGSKITPERVAEIVKDIYYREQREKERIAEEEAQRVSFMDFYAQFLDDMRTGKEQGKGGKRFAPLTIRHFNQGYNRLLDYQDYIGKKIDWEDIDANFVRDYTYFLQHLTELCKDDQRNGRKKNKAGEPIKGGKRIVDYSDNTTGTRLKELKYLMKKYTERATKIDTSSIRRNRDAIEAKNTHESDAIYLTAKELEAFKNADISSLSKGYEYARDIFLVGCYTAQRISDYNKISRDNIKTREIIRKRGEVEVIEERLVIELRQKKTGTKVIIPVKRELREILEKYDYNLPHLADQVLNRYIKTIAELAGINEPTPIRSTNGGKEVTEIRPQYELCTSHTARRTGATLMYLAGMQSFDIMRITGHSTPIMLEKYIKASELEVSDNLTTKYDYFA